MQEIEEARELAEKTGDWTAFYELIEALADRDYESYLRHAA